MVAQLPLVDVTEGGRTEFMLILRQLFGNLAAPFVIVEQMQLLTFV